MNIRFVFILTAIIFNSCKKTKTNDAIIHRKDSTETKLPQKTNTLVEAETKYVNAFSGLRYRENPNGKILGKLPYNSKVSVIKHSGIFSQIKDNNNFIESEWVGIHLNNDTVYVFNAFLSEKINKTGIWAKFPLKKMPFVDSTNFDNMILKNKLSINEIKKLQLQELYPDLLKEDRDFNAYPSYQLDLKNDQLQCIAVLVTKADHEIETVLVVYENEKLMKYYGNSHEKPLINSLVVSYDEIAEGWSRITSEIKNNSITKIDALYTEPPRIDTTLHHINRLGYINKVTINFKNNIRPNQKLKLHTVYTDTIRFMNYNDNYDYFFLEAKKNNKDVSLIYNWDITKKYDFKKNDLIKIQWKIDSIFIAGDGETLSFSEYVIDAKRIE